MPSMIYRNVFKFVFWVIISLQLITHSMTSLGQLAPALPQVIIDEQGNESPLFIPPSQNPTIPSSMQYSANIHVPSLSGIASYSNPVTEQPNPLAYPKPFSKNNKYAGMSYSLSMPTGKLKVSSTTNQINAYNQSNGLEIHGGYFVRDKIAFEGAYAYHPYRHKLEPSIKDHLHTFRLSGKYFFDMGVPLFPNVGLGLAYHQFDGKSRISPVASLGTQYQYDPQISVGLDMVYQYMNVNLNKERVLGETTIRYEKLKMRPFDFNFFVRYYF